MARDEKKSAPSAPNPKRAEPFNNPFAKLAAHPAAKASPATTDTPAKAEAPAKTDAVRRAGPARAVVRYERKGRGGKEVTVVEKLDLPPKTLEQWLKSLKQSLGVGGQLEGTSLVLQGDQRERLRALLEKLGVGQISVG